MQLAGVFYPAGSSQRQQAVLSVGSDGRVRIKHAQTQESLLEAQSFSDINISARVGNTPRHLEFETGSRFESEDNDAIDELMRQWQRGGGYRLAHRLESHLPVVLVFTLFTVFFVWGFVKFGLPASADLIADMLPDETSQYIGSGTLELLDESLFEPSELPVARQQQLQQLFTLYTNRYAQYGAKVRFRKSDGIGANALALPDGHIVFTDDMVKLAEDDYELVAILGHEIGHLVHKHMLRKIIQSSALTLALVLVTGDVNSASSVVVAVPTLLLELSYSRDFEREADDFGYQFLVDNDIPTWHFARIMRRLDPSHDHSHSREHRKPSDSSKPYEEPAGIPNYLSTHPATLERIERFEAELTN